MLAHCDHRGRIGAATVRRQPRCVMPCAVYAPAVFAGAVGAA